MPQDLFPSILLAYAIMMIQIEPILCALGTATTVISWIVIFICLLAANKMAKREKVKVSI